MTAKVIASGSKGNAVLYHDLILVDCGVPYFLVEPFKKQIQIILLTHVHADHFLIGTIKKLQSQRPAIRIGCCEWMLPHLQGIDNIDVYEIGKLYDYVHFKLSPVKGYHDVPTCGYRIFKDGHKTLHITDTSHLEGITAKGYDLFAIEANYDEETHLEAIARKKANGEYAHEVGAMNSHLSADQAWNFIAKNRKETSEVIKLHESQSV